MASARIRRIADAFAHREPDRTPLFEIFQPYHPIHWNICGRNAATDMAKAWDAMSDGIAWRELIDQHVKAQYEISRYFGLDMVRLNGAPPEDYPRPTKTGSESWVLDGVEYRLNPRTSLVVPVSPLPLTEKITEKEVRRKISEWDGNVPAGYLTELPVLQGVRALAQEDDVDWVFMGEVGAGTGAAFYPPFMLMWLISEPELLRRWIEREKAIGFAITEQLVRSGCSVIAMGGDVSCDKGPFISPAHYREFILPVIQSHVNLIHCLGAKAVYTSDGNHWPIKDEFFHQSRVDGFKEVDKAAGMTWPKLIAEHVSESVCIIGNIDARHTLCLGTAEEVRAEVVECLTYGQETPGGHILHASHSVHEDVKPENYYAVVDAYRDFFGIDKLAR